MNDLLDFESLRQTSAGHDPYDHLVASALLSPESVRSLAAEFPRVAVSGLLPASTLRLSPLLSQLADELRGPRMAGLLGGKFGVDLENRPTMLTVRSQCAPRDGRIHTDSESKIVTLLLYLNPDWQQEGGRLRLLRSGTDITDYAEEVSPLGGTMVAFRRCEHSWHGHLPFTGTRRYLMVNWMRNPAITAIEQARHRVAATFKGVFAKGAFA
jgi:SM-20-related protein